MNIKVKNFRDLMNKLVRFKGPMIVRWGQRQKTGHSCRFKGRTSVLVVVLGVVMRSYLFLQVSKRLR